MENNEWITKKGYYILPMGLNDDENIMVNLLAKQIKKACKNTLLKNDDNIRLWLVAGSGGICHALNIAFPKIKLFILLTGHGKYKQNVLNWAKNKKNIFILKQKLNNNINDSQLYYDSVKNYDDLIFPYVKQFGKYGDFIWNVASD